MRETAVATTKGRFKPYRGYKDSGMAWLGLIPSAWNIRRLKHLVRFQGGGTPSKENPEYWAGVMRHLAQVVRNGLGDRAGTCIDPSVQVVQGRAVCVVSCQRSPEPVFLKWEGTEAAPDGDFYVRSGPGTVRLAPDSAKEYIRTRFRAAA